MKKAMLITGASRGIGLELARIAAKDGNDLVLVARNKTSLAVLSKELLEYGVEVGTYTCDLSNTAEAKQLVAKIRKDGLTVTCVINNAGVGVYGLFTDTRWDAEESMINLNITSLTYLSKAFIPDMQKAGGGRIMNVASTAAFQPGPYMAVYYATKAYVLSLTEALNEELKDNRITATALCPGPTQSAFERTANIDASAGLFSGKLPTSKSVAKYGYASMMSGKRVAIHGVKNRVGVLAARFLPTRIVTHIIAAVSKPRD